jgi:hypothetical protein
MLMNGSHERVTFRLPAANGGARWVVVVDSGQKNGERIRKAYEAERKIAVMARSMLVFVCETRSQKDRRR